MCRQLLSLIFLAYCGTSLAQTHAIPFVNAPLSPSAVTPGSPTFTLTVNGTGFIPASVVKWNGTALATRFVSRNQLTATVVASRVATPVTASVTVINLIPGGGASLPVWFNVTNPTPAPAYEVSSVIPVGTAPLDIVAADFNADGKSDLAVITQCGTDPNCPPFASNPSISILLGNGDGTFEAQELLASGGYPFAAVSGDFNRDGKVDLAVITQDNCGGCAQVELYLGNGDGSFANGQRIIGLNGSLSAIVTGDFNRDGNLDLAVSGTPTVPLLLVFLGSGDGNFTSSAYTFPDIPLSPVAVTTGDYNQDGRLDLAVFDLEASPNSTSRILLGDGDGTFVSNAPAGPLPLNVSSASSSPRSMATGDVDGDGNLDLAFVDVSSTLVVLAGRSDGTFVPRSNQPVQGKFANVSTADFNGDGALDLAVVYAGTGLSIYLGNGDGTFQMPISLNAGDAPDGGVGIADFNGDGRLDIAIANYNDNTISIILNSWLPSWTTLVSSTNPAYATQPLTLTAAVTGASGNVTGTITFQSGSKILCVATLVGRTASCTLAFAKVGTKSMQAYYSGDAGFRPSLSAIVQQSIIRAPSDVAIVSSVNPSHAGAPVSFKASVTSVVGSPADGEQVIFKEDTVAIGTGTLSGGVATFMTSSLSPGKHSIKATFSGDSVLRAYTSTALRQAVN